MPTRDSDFTPIDAGGGFFEDGAPAMGGILRNVMTAPYMHDGRFATLDGFDHYSHGIQTFPPSTPAFGIGTGGFTGGPDLIDPIIFPGGSGRTPPVRLTSPPKSGSPSRPS